MSCYICDLDTDTKKEVDDIIRDSKNGKEIVKRCKDSEIEISLKDITYHKKHMDEEDVGVFYLRDSVLYDAETDEPVQFMAPDLVLKIVITLGIKNALKNPSKISIRYLVEAAKILADIGTNNIIEDVLQNAYLDQLKAKPNIQDHTPTELPYQATPDYRAEQERKKEEFLKLVRPNPSG